MLKCKLTETKIVVVGVVVVIIHLKRPGELLAIDTKYRTSRKLED